MVKNQKKEPKTNKTPKRNPIKKANQHQQKQRQCSSEISPTTTRLSISQEPQQEPNIDILKEQALQIMKGGLNDVKSKLRFRDDQIGKIRGVIDKFWSKDYGGCKALMVTGGPGVGKSASVSWLLDKLEKVRVIKVNANVVTSLQEVQDIVVKELLGKTARMSSKQVTQQLIAKKYKQRTIVYIEQIDNNLKCPQTPTTTFSFFSLFTKRNLPIMLIGISNTIDTLQRYIEKTYGGLMGKIHNIVFRPFSIRECHAIIDLKLKDVQTRTGLRVVVPEDISLHCLQKLPTARRGDLRVVYKFFENVLHELFRKGSPSQATFQLTQQGSSNLLAQQQQSPQKAILQQLLQHHQLILIALQQIQNRYPDQLYIFETQLYHKIKAIYQKLGINPATISKRQIFQSLEELERDSLIKIRNRGRGRGRGKGEVEILMMVDQGMIGKYLGRPFFRRLCGEDVKEEDEKEKDKGIEKKEESKVEVEFEISADMKLE